jgi:dTDP-4-dehydrorhamnose reductase
MTKNLPIKILIIGAKGMLGQELVKVFSSGKSIEIIAWDKEELDITNHIEVNEKISELKPNIIINAAAYNAVDKAEDPKEFEIAKKINGEAPGYLAIIAKKIDAVLVHYSTDYVFDGEPEIPEPQGCHHNCGSCGLHEGFEPKIGFDENAKPNPINNYGRSKLMGEQAIQKNADKYYIIRLSKLFGKTATAPGAKKSFFDVMLEAGKKNKGVHPVKSPLKRGTTKSQFDGVKVIDEETSCFTYAPDLAVKTREIITAEKPFGIYHVVNSDPCTWYEAVLELYQEAKIKTKVVPVMTDEFPRPAKRPYYSVLLNTKLNPLRSYKDALKEFLKTQK